MPPLRDPWVIDRLRDAARDALAKGMLQPAVAYLERALAEPPAPALRPQVLFELGDAETQLGRPASTDTLAWALAATTNPAAGARVALRLAQDLLTARELPRALQVLTAAITEADAAEVDPDLRTRLEAEYIGVAVSRPDTRADALARLDRLLPDVRPDTLAGCMLLATASFELLQTPGRAEEAVTGPPRPDRYRPAGPSLPHRGALPGGTRAGRGRHHRPGHGPGRDGRGRRPGTRRAGRARRRPQLPRRGRIPARVAAGRRGRRGLSQELAEQADVPYHRRLTLTTLLPVLVDAPPPAPPSESSPDCTSGWLCRPQSR